MVERAVELFRSRLANCAQSVAQAWCEKTGRNSQEYEYLSGSGRGQAPDGACGALYAARCVVGEDRAAQVEAAFAEASGGLTRCQEIRARRALTCIECVRTAATALSQHNDSSTPP